jgi:WD40 repeat protein
VKENPYFQRVSASFVPVLGDETDTIQTPPPLRMFARESLVCGDQGTLAGKSAVAVSANGIRADTGQMPDNLKLWDIESVSLIREFGERRRRASVVAVALLPDGIAAVSRAILGHGTRGTRPGRDNRLGASNLLDFGYLNLWLPLQRIVK